MAKKQGHQRGFGIIEIIILLVVIGLLAFAGWRVYQNNRTKVSDAAGSSTQNSSTTGQSQKPDVAYLKIKEWGIKLPLSKEVNDAYYVASVSSVGKDGLPNAIFLGLKSLDSFGCTADGGNHGKNSAVGAILRVSPGETDEVTGNLIMDEYPNGTTIDGHYYAYAAWVNETCGTANYLQSVETVFATVARNSIKSAPD